MIAHRGCGRFEVESESPGEGSFFYPATSPPPPPPPKKAWTEPATRESRAGRASTNPYWQPAFSIFPGRERKREEVTPANPTKGLPPPRPRCYSAHTWGGGAQRTWLGLLTGISSASLKIGRPLVTGKYLILSAN